MEINRFPGRVIEAGGKQYLYFGGTAYLGLATHPRFQENVIKALRKWGSFYGSSRNANVKLSIFNDFEDYFAGFLGVAATLTVSSGTLAGKLAVDYFLGKGFEFYHFSRSHPAVTAKNSSPVNINDRLHPNLSNSTVENIVIAADAIESGETVATDFGVLGRVHKNKQITLLLDESHTLGILGKNGSGISKELKVPAVKNIVVISSLSKALSMSGGIIGGSRAFINSLKEQSTFVSSSPANAVYLEAFMHSEDIYIAQREKLSNNLKYIDENLDNDRLTFSKSYPVIYFDDDDIFDSLNQAGIIISRFSYPTYKKDEQNSDNGKPYPIGFG